jgi:hypothetical protein
VLDRQQHFIGFVNYTIQNTSDHYRGALQEAMYPGFTPIVNGVSYPGFQAFHGAATFHTLSLNLNYNNAGYFVLNLLADKNTDFPAPIPYYYQFTQSSITNQSSVSGGFGRPPYDVTLDMRFRIHPHMSLDIQRSYYFNYGNLRWSPQFVFQVMQ